MAARADSLARPAWLASPPCLLRGPLGRRGGPCLGPCWPRGELAAPARTPPAAGGWAHLLRLRPTRDISAISQAAGVPSSPPAPRNCGPHKSRSGTRICRHESGRNHVRCCHGSGWSTRSRPVGSDRACWPERPCLVPPPPPPPARFPAFGGLRTPVYGPDSRQLPSPGLPPASGPAAGYVVAAAGATFFFPPHQLACPRSTPAEGI